MRFSRELADVRQDPRAVVALCDRLFRRFKGVDGFARIWAEAIEGARRDGQMGRRFVLNSLVAITRLVEVSEAYQEAHKPDLGRMSDDELKAHLRWIMGLPDEAAGEEER